MNMKPYYKKGGFFYWLERLSDWIDDEIDSIEYHFKLYGFMYFVPGFRKIAVSKFWIDDSVLDVEFAKKNLANEIAEYNREKYWWMRAK